ncbi:MAG: DUF3152 domain-containing protein [Candidatus Paceibacterota bacterium]|jgi:hypothetical protein
MHLRQIVHVVLTIVLMLGISLSARSSFATKATTDKLSDSLKGLQTLPSVINSIAAPELQNPKWLQEQLAAKVASKQQVYYSVITRGIITADLTEFRSQANATLNSGQGWSRLGVSFQEVSSGGNFLLVLSEASQVPSFSSVCSTIYSCRVGSYVIINQDRWLAATTSWNEAGGSLRDYRHMVINHEIGHWLGHDHGTCSGAGQLAAVMQQQSISLGGCNFNPWPLDSELWSTQLGIYL